MLISPRPRRWLSITCLVLISLLVLLPLVGLLYHALFIDSVALKSTPLSLSKIWQQYKFSGLIYRTLLLGFSVATFNIVLGMWIAWVTHRYHFIGRKVLLFFTLIPLAIPSFIYAATLRDSLSPGGWVGEFFNFPIFMGFFPVTLVLILATLPYTQLLLATQLANVNYQQEESAARLLGASTQQIFWKITWPYVRPTVFFSWLMSFLYAISDFGAVAVLNYPVLTWYLYQAIEYQQLLLSSMMGSVLLIISLPLYFLTRLLQGDKLQSYREKPSLWAAVKLPSSAYLAVVLTFFVLIVPGVFIPLATLGQWVYQGWLLELPFAPIHSALGATMLLTVVSAIFMVSIAFLPAWIASYSHKWLSNFLEQMIYLIGGLPAILLAFGLLLAALMVSTLSASPALYHFLLVSGILLLFGYIVRFLPQAYTYLKSAILNLDQHQYVSARLLGATDTYWWRHLALPRLLPNIYAAAVVVILSVSKELPITLLLGNATGLQPLSVRIFDRYQEAFLYDAGLAGLLLIAICGLLTLISLRWKIYVSG